MAQIRSMIQSHDANPKITAEIKETLKLLQELASSKATILEEMIKSDLQTGKAVDNLTIPITKVVTSKVEYRCMMNNEIGKIVPEITKSVGNIFQGEGKVLDSVASILSTGINAIMGSGKGQEAFQRTYLVLSEYPAIVRFDFAFWGRVVEAKAITEYTENVFACVAYKSAVDVSKLYFNDFLSIYSPILNMAFGSNKEKLKEMIKESKEIYSMLLPPANNAAIVPQLDITPEVMNVVNANKQKIYTSFKSQKVTDGLF